MELKLLEIDHIHVLKEMASKNCFLRIIADVFLLGIVLRTPTE